jgi:hypothetical protein
MIRAAPAAAAGAAAAAAPAAPCWRFSDAHIAASPSAADGMPAATEAALRRAGAAHVLETVRLVVSAPYRALPEASRPPSGVLDARARLPASCALVLFARFFMRQSFMRHDRFVRGAGGGRRRRAQRAARPS